MSRKALKSLFIVQIFLASTGLLSAAEINLSDAAQSCSADSYVAADIKSNELAPSRRDSSLYLESEEVQKYYQNNQKNDFVLVDVRLGEEYEASRVPGSLNIPMQQVKYKKYLKNKRLVLMNSGKKYRDLEKIVHELRAKGYERAYILDGGIAEWYKQTKQVDGDFSSRKYLNLISTPEFLAEAQHGPWVVVDLDEEKAFNTYVNGHVLNIPYDTVFRLNFQSKLRELDVGPETRFLFVSNQKDIYQKLVPEFMKMKLRNYYVLSEVTEFLSIYKKQMAAAIHMSRQKEAGCQFP